MGSNLQACLSCTAAHWLVRVSSGGTGSRAQPDTPSLQVPILSPLRSKTSRCFSKGEVEVGVRGLQPPSECCHVAGLRNEIIGIESDMARWTSGQGDQLADSQCKQCWLLRSMLPYCFMVIRQQDPTFHEHVALLPERHTCACDGSARCMEYAQILQAQQPHEANISHTSS